MAPGSSMNRALSQSVSIETAIQLLVVLESELRTELQMKRQAY
jgi:hypothetical protein